MEINAALESLAALAQDTRLAVFRRLVVAGPAGLPVARIGEAVPTSPATLSFHLKELSRAGLIRARQKGRQIFYSAEYAHMNALIGFLTENCCAQDAACCGPDDGSRALLSCQSGESTPRVMRGGATRSDRVSGPAIDPHKDIAKARTRAKRAEASRSNRMPAPATRSSSQREDSPPRKDAREARVRSRRAPPKGKAQSTGGRR